VLCQLNNVGCILNKCAVLRSVYPQQTMDACMTSACGHRQENTNLTKISRNHILLWDFFGGLCCAELLCCHGSSCVESSRQRVLSSHVHDVLAHYAN
jgi:hypothetical protein